MPDGSWNVSADVPEVRRGRGASVNVANRFERTAAEAFDDGWDTIRDESLAPPPVATTLARDATKTAISWNKSPDLGFDRAVNPYRGCEHGCIYCYARPTHAYLDHSPGLDFETKLYFKPDAPEVLERELSNPRYTPRRIQLGASTDPYQPIERDLQITRRILEVLERFNHPVGITTKGGLVARDADILGRMAEKRLAFVVVAVTTLDRKLARAMEPRATTPEKRFETIATLSAAGVPVAVGLSPMIPGLTDHEMDAILQRAAEAGARTAYYSTLRMPREIKDLFREWLAAERPDAASKVISMVRQTHGGQDYDPEFGKRLRGEGPIAEMMHARFRVARRRYRLERYSEDLRTDLFRIPAKAGDQLSLFG